MKNKIYIVGIVAFLLVWFGLTGAAWFGKPETESMSERRKLAQAPTLNWETIVAKDVLNEDGTVKIAKSYKTLFEKYSLDQFPLRDRFRQAKAIFSNYVMQQMDDNGYYIQDGQAAELVYPLQEKMLSWNIQVLKSIQESFLGKCKVYTAIVPDKGYYLAQQNGYLSVDYNQMFQAVKDGLPGATYIDLTGALSAEDYYRTDTHWRQERIVPVAQLMAEQMGTKVDGEAAYTQEKVKNPFYGCYYGFAALPMDPEDMYLMHSQVLDNCRVQKFQKLGAVPGQVVLEPAELYDMTQAESNDLYNIFFSGNQVMMQLTNTKPTNGRELIIIGDSYARSMAPLLLSGYRKVTVLDLRIVKIRDVLDQYMTFNANQDVLFLYSTISLNSAIAQ